MVIIAIFFAITLYLNIGWAIGTYYGKYLNGRNVTPATLLQKIAAGWEWFWIWDDGRRSLQIVHMFFWPIILCLWAISWAICGIYYMLYFIFGGFAKLIGLG